MFGSPKSPPWNTSLASVQSVNPGFGIFLLNIEGYRKHGKNTLSQEDVKPPKKIMNQRQKRQMMVKHSQKIKSPRPLPDSDSISMVSHGKGQFQYVPRRNTSTKSNHCTSPLCEKQYHEILPLFSKIYETHALCRHCKIYYPRFKLVAEVKCPCCGLRVRQGPSSRRGKEKAARNKEILKRENEKIAIQFGLSPTIKRIQLEKLLKIQG